jgi:3-phenylpropionate/cinnamic acid dioxygenase small subunit
MDEIKLHHRINLLNADYARCIDDDRMEEWPGFFVEDCLYKITTADNHARGREAGLVYADSRAMLQDRVSALREANIYERQRYRHMTGVPTVLDVQGEAHSFEVRVEVPFLVTRIMRDGSMDVFATGRYLDRVVEQGGRLMFKERLAVCDSNRFDTLVALPL